MVCGLYLDKAGVEYEYLLVLVLGEDGEVGGPLPQQVHPVQDPLRAVRAGPEISRHGIVLITILLNEADHQFIIRPLVSFRIH